MQTASGASLSDPAPSSSRGRPGLTLVLSAVAGVVYVVDQVTKWLAVEQLQPDQPVRLVADLLQLRLTRNPGAAFSFVTGMTWLLTVVAVVVVVAVLRVARRLGSTGWAWALGLLLGGALGNLTDRLVRAPGIGRGHVVDFIAYGHLFIGNVADIAIVLAAVLVGFLALRGRTLDGSRSTPEGASHD